MSQATALQYLAAARTVRRVSRAESRPARRAARALLRPRLASPLRELPRCREDEQNGVVNAAHLRGGSRPAADGGRYDRDALRRGGPHGGGSNACAVPPRRVPRLSCAKSASCRRAQWRTKSLGWRGLPPEVMVTRATCSTACSRCRGRH